jgi:hypothetical protein
MLPSFGLSFACLSSASSQVLFNCWWPSQAGGVLLCWWTSMLAELLSLVSADDSG